MSNAKRTWTYQGRQITGELVDFAVETEGRLSLQLSDGALLHVRPVVAQVLKTNERTPTGERLYLLMSMTQVSVFKDPPEDAVEHDRDRGDKQ